MKIKLLISVSILLFFYIGTFSQTQKRVMSLPLEYFHPKEENTKNVSVLHDEFFKKIAWIVHCDRNNITTSNGKKVSFGEQFYVVEEEVGRIHIVKDPGLYNYTRTSSEIVDYGWVDKTQFLLWPYAIVDNKRLIDLKALLINTKQTKSNDVGHTVKLYKNPDASAEVIGSQNIESIQFIYKEENNFYLLGINYKIKNFEENGLLGWVHKSQVYVWNTRICLEPNWEEDAVAERLSNSNLQALTFIDRKATEDFIQGNINPESVISSMDPPFAQEQANIIDNRFRGAWIRYPIMDFERNVKNTNMYQIGIDSKISESILKAKEDIRKAHIIASNKANHINVLFVVDGTSSMNSYYSPIISTISEKITDMKKQCEAEDATIQFGAFVYRDLMEGERLLEKKELTTNAYDIINFLQNVDTHDKKDTDKLESVYYGIYRALIEGGFKRNETNIMIVVGDAGDWSVDQKRIKNDGSSVAYVDVNKILNELYRYEVHFMAVQCQHLQHQAYVDFQSQMKWLMTENAKRNFAEATKLNPGLDCSLGVQEKGQNTFLNNSVVVGKLICPENDKLDPGYLGVELSSLIDDAFSFQQRIYDLVKKIQFEPGMKVPDEFGPAVSKLFQGNFNSNNMKEFAQNRYKFMVSGFTAMKPGKAQHDIYKYVLMMTEDDLSNLKLLFDNLSEKRTYPPDVQRRELVIAWKTILSQYIGDLTPERFNNLTFEDIDLITQGVPLNRQTVLRNYKIKDLENPKVISDALVRNYLISLYKKSKDISNIIKLRSNYPYNYLRGDYFYYWIPADKLP